MTFTLGQRHFDSAKELARKKALADIDLDNETPITAELGLINAPYIWDDLDQKDILFEITGEKLDPSAQSDNTDDIIELLDTFESTYYDTIDEYEGDIAA